jgi:hypothetical protein
MARETKEIEGKEEQRLQTKIIRLIIYLLHTTTTRSRVAQSV